MSLKGVKVLEFTGLAPGPFCGKILADFGANVTRIDRVADNQLDILQHGKQTLAVNLKDERGQQIVQKLAKIYDVLIEPFRPGVMEKLNLGPEKLCTANPKLIYARLTGFGQSGRLSQRAGHDTNYLAISGVLSMLGSHDAKPNPPVNILADMAGGGLMCALGICLALLERHNSGRGQIVDASMVEGAAYVASWLFMSRSLPIWGKSRGKNILDGGVFYYDIYETKDGKYMSVGALEPQFFETFKRLLQLPDSLQQFTTDDEVQKKAKLLVTQAFRQKTQAEWSKIFEDVDACVYPVVNWEEVLQHDHNRDRKSFEIVDNVIIPKPAPNLSRTPGKVHTESLLSKGKLNDKREAAISLLSNTLKLSSVELNNLIDDGVIILPPKLATL